MFGQWMGDNRIDLKLEREEHQMTDKQKEAIETLFHLEHVNGYVDLYEKHDVIIKSDILLKWKNATKEVLNLIQTEQAEIKEYKKIIAQDNKKYEHMKKSLKGIISRSNAEIDSLKDFKEIAESKVTDLNPIGLARTNQLLSRQCHKLQEESEKKDEWINKLETKLMYALTPTKHELAKRTQEEFKRVIRENIDEDTYTIKRKLKEEWNNL